MDATSLRIGVILGSTRPRRRGASVAAWVMDQVRDRPASYDLVDLADHVLPLLDEPAAAATGHYEHPYTRAWAATVAQYDAFVLISPEYNHGVSGVLKNAIDYLWAEWLDKAAGIVSYGNGGGQRSAEHLRGVLSAVGIAHVRPQVTLFNREDFDGYDAVPRDHQAGALADMLVDLELWAAAMREVRAAR